MTRESKAKDGAPLGIDGQPLETGRLWGRPPGLEERTTATAKVQALRDVHEALSSELRDARERALRKTGWRDHYAAGEAAALERACALVQRRLDIQRAALARTGRAR